jgi:hypothetical protein
MLNWAEDGAEGGDRRRGGSGSYRRRWRHGVLQAGVPEDGGKVVEELLQVGVVLLVPLAEVGRLCVGGSIGGRAAAERVAHRRCGEQHSVRENGIGWVNELQGVTVVL